MAIDFKKALKKTPAAPAAPAAPQTPQKKFAPSTPTKQESKSGSWYARGKASANAMAKDQQRAKERQEQMGKTWRFLLDKGEEARLTFVDGNLTEEGVLDVLTYREHYIHASKSRYVCTQDVEPCPICEQGGREGDAKLVGALTVIDHRVREGEKATYKDQRRMFVATRPVLQILQGLAAKRGGLAGCTFDVKRPDEKNSPGCGNIFDFIEHNDPKVLVKKYIGKDKDNKPVALFHPVDYEDEIIYHTAAELRAMGFGGAAPVGGESKVSEKELGEALDD